MGLFSRIVLLAVLGFAGYVGWVQYNHAPHENGFGFRTEANDVVKGVNLKGKNVLITGASRGGIGHPTAVALALTGANVHLACRSLKKCEETMNDITSKQSDASVFVHELDLASLASVEAFAKNFNQQNIPLHILVNNAGIAANGKTEDGHSTMWQTNHLSHFYLVNLLWDSLKLGAPSRVVVVASRAHVRGVLNISEVESPAWFSDSVLDIMPIYGKTKGANIVHALELNKRMEAEGIGHAYSLHPGVIATEFQRVFLPAKYLFKFFALFEFSKTIEQGAATQVYLAVSNDPIVRDNAGKYFSDCWLEQTDPTLDLLLGPALWELSQKHIDAYLAKKTNRE